MNYEFMNFQETFKPLEPYIWKTHSLQQLKLFRSTLLSINRSENKQLGRFSSKRLNS